MEIFTARVSRIRTLTHDVREIELTLEEPGEIHFAPGQFVSFEIERPGLPFPATRPYSIASAPTSRHVIELVLNRVPGGPGSEYLFGLREGDLTTFRGPVGTFILRNSHRDLLFVATGTGIAPIRSMLWFLADTSSLRACTLYWACGASEICITRMTWPVLAGTCVTFHSRRHCRSPAAPGKVRLVGSRC
jgi:NAD(P)H-flavin reductase